jgi:DNA-binding CsgD family transcriptional regulator
MILAHPGEVARIVENASVAAAVLQGGSNPYLPTLSSLKLVSTSSTSETGKSKRNQIQKLLLAGRSPKRIAEALHASPAIVWAFLESSIRPWS